MKNTSCPRCHKNLPVHENRAFKTTIRGNDLSVFDAISQLAIYDVVICPFCEKYFQSLDAKLFGFFKSPFTVMALGMLFIIILLYFVYLIE